MFKKIRAWKGLFAGLSRRTGEGTRERTGEGTRGSPRESPGKVPGKNVNVPLRDGMIPATDAGTVPKAATIEKTEAGLPETRRALS
jgi:hypothetical protein